MKSIQRSMILLAALALCGAGCSSDSEGGGTGGSGTASGGSTSEGTTSGGTSGGESSSGGSSSKDGGGGSVAKSGSTSSGGASGSSSHVDTSSAPGSGGAAGSGGGKKTGGTTGSGGAGGSVGGKNTGGSGGRDVTGSRAGSTSAGGRSDTAGATGSGGATGGSTSTTPDTGPSSDPDPSPGCSATPVTTSPCPASGAACTIDVKGTKREYYLELPKGYDGKKPAPVVWQYHPWGGTGKGGMTMYSLNSRLTEVIFVSPHGTGSPIGFPNTNGMDEDMTRAVNAEIEAKFCTDKSRYFATGFSYGGSMSFTAACNMSDIFRGIGAQAGSTVSGATCARKTPARKVAIWATHGDADTTLPIKNTTPMIEALVKNNGCSSTTKPVDPSPCVAYEGCDEGYPVVWCIRPGDGHAMASTAPDAITKFFRQFF